MMFRIQKTTATGATRNRARMNGRVTAVCAAFTAFAAWHSGSAAALEWPTENPEIRSLFGQKSAYSVERGLVIENVATVRTAGDGELLTVITTNENMNGFPSTLGNAALIAHDDGLVSIYGNLETTDSLSGRIHIEQNAVLSQAGGTAWGNAPATDAQRGDGGNECIFQIMDQKQENLLNPLLLLPPKEDTRRPAIKSVTLESESGQTYQLANSRYVRSGAYKIHADITDTYPQSRTELAPFRISVIVNGMESISIPFETLRKKGGSLVPNVTPAYLDGTTALYNEAGQIYIGDISLTRGKTEMTVSARDFAGNEQTAVFMLQAE